MENPNDFNDPIVGKTRVSITLESGKTISGLVMKLFDDDNGGMRVYLKADDGWVYSLPWPTN